jgi:hypothetical protein
MNALRFSIVCSLALFLLGCASEPTPPPRAFLEGRVHDISHRDVQHIIALAKKDLTATGRASHPIYCVYVERADLVYVYHGEQRKRASDIEEFLIIERIKGRWQLGEREVVRGVNIPT